MKKTLITFALYLMTVLLNAEITPGDQPLSWDTTLNIKEYSLKETIIAAPDTANIRRTHRKEYVAFPVSVNFTPENSGEWQTLEDGSKLWRLKVRFPGAYSIFFLYNKFWLPEGSKFYTYSNDMEEYHIDYHTWDSSKENPCTHESRMLSGETAVLEYFQSAWVTDTAVISVNRLGYGYRLYETINEINKPLLNTRINLGKKPLSWDTSLNIKEYSLEEMIVPTPAPDMEKMHEARRTGGFIMGMAAVNFTPENSGEWQTLEDGSKLWILKIRYTGARSTAVFYDNFWLPEGSRYCIFCDDTKNFSVFGNTCLNEKEPRSTMHGTLPGEAVVLEYFQPVWVTDTAVISVNSLGCEYPKKLYEIIDARIAQEKKPLSWDTSLNIKEYSLEETIVAAPDIEEIRRRHEKGSDALGVPVNFTLENSGEWQTLEDGSKLWRLKIRFPGAHFIIIYHNKRHWLPKESRFYAYSNDTKECYVHHYEKHLSEEIPRGYASGMVRGETIVLEYFQSAWVTDTAIISIDNLGYGYNPKELYDEANEADSSKK